jgi:hypothetical protein
MHFVIKHVFCFFALAAVLGTGTAIAQEKKLFTADSHKERGLTCAACHNEEQPKTAASGDACLTCHNSIEAVAERIKDFEKDPHKNHITDGSDIACTACHQGHKDNISLCHQCHAGLKFEKKQAEAK